MNNSIRLLPVFVLGLASIASAGDVFRFGTPLDVRLQKNLRIKHELELVDVIQRRETDKAEVSKKVQGFVQNEIVVALVEEVLETSDRRPLKMRRLMDDCTGRGRARLAMGGGGQGIFSLNFQSPLRKRTMLFTWVEEEQDYGRYADSIDGPEFHMRWLDGDLEMLSALPEGEVEVGQTWEVPADRMEMLIAPGGNMHLWPKQIGDIFQRNVLMGLGGNVAELLTDDVQGHATATYLGRQEVEGMEVGVVEFELQLTALADKTRRYQEAMPREERANPTVLDAMIMSFNVSGKGTLHWDFENGRLHNYRFEGQQHVSGAVTKTVGLLDMPEGFQVTEEMRLEGGLFIDLEFAGPYAN